MRRQHLSTLLLLPSLSSGTLVVSIAGVLVAINAWAYVRDNSLFYDLLFGPYGLRTFIWQQSAHATAVRDAFLATPIAYYIFVTIAAIAAGVIVYTLLQVTSLFVSGTLQAWSSLGTLGAPRKVVRRMLFIRLVLRVTGLLGWAAFGAFFFSTLLPSMLVLNQSGVSHIIHGDIWGLVNCLVAFVVLALSVHVQIVFVRLAFLRPRLFWSGDEAVLEAETVDD